MNKTTVPIKGMHCHSCEILIEDELLKISGVKKIAVSQKRGMAEIYHQDTHISHEEIKTAVENAGYQIGQEEKLPLFSKNIHDYKDLGTAFLLVTMLYLIASDLGLFNITVKPDGSYNNLSVVLLIGVTAGVSTCMALVGGLVLAVSTRFAEKHPHASSFHRFKPHLFFNLGRVISFFVLGAIIGFAGSFLQFSGTTLGLLTIAVGGVMLLLGLQLTEIFPRLSKVNLTLPKTLTRFLGIKQHSDREYSDKNSAVMGALTFFLPCGFTQAMQLYSVSSGNAATGALTMGTFALGTIPGLLGIGGLTSVIRGAFAKTFFKFAGVVVIALAFFNIKNGYNLAGLNFVSLSYLKSAPIARAADPNVTLENGVQIVKMSQTAGGYTPNKFTIEKNIPVRWVIDSKDPYSCAGSIVLSKFGIRRNLTAGENIIEFTPSETGQLRFSCSMGMYTGVFNVVDEGNNSSVSVQENQTDGSTPPKADSCGMGSGCSCGMK